MRIHRKIAEALEGLLLESDKAYTASVKRDAIMRTQTSIFLSLGLRNPELMQRGFDSLLNIRVAFRDDMMRLVQGFSGGVGRAGDEAWVVREWKALTSRHYQNLFRAGAMAVGNPYYADSSIGLTKRDLAFISKARREELRFFRNFLRDIRDPNHNPIRHPYLARATYYAESGKAQFYNGMVAGAGDELEISWVMGEPEEHCADCPVLASSVYTWSTLPTTPGAGDTECIFNCYCHLEFQPRKVGPLPGVAGGPISPGSSSQYAFDAPGRWARVDLNGRLMSGEAAKRADDLFASMNQARQMISLTKGAERADWIRIRRRINAEIVSLSADNGFRVTPTTAVSDLLAAAKAGRAKGLGGLLYHSDLRVGMEIVVVRGDAVMVGMVSAADYNRKIFYDARGEIFVIRESDVLFNVNPIRPTSAITPGAAPGVGTFPNFAKMTTVGEIVEALSDLGFTKVYGLDKIPIEYARAWAEETARTWKETGIATPFGGIGAVRSPGGWNAQAYVPQRHAKAILFDFDEKRVSMAFQDPALSSAPPEKNAVEVRVQWAGTKESIASTIKSSRNYKDELGYFWSSESKLKTKLPKGLTAEERKVRNTANHEVAHQSFERMTIGAMKKWTDFFVSKDRKWWGKNVSGYAASGARSDAYKSKISGTSYEFTVAAREADKIHAHEAFAETFALMKAIERGWLARSALNKELVKAFEETMKLGYDKNWF